MSIVSLVVAPTLAQIHGSGAIKETSIIKPVKQVTETKTKLNATNTASFINN
jgi:hypothetical protein